MSSVGIEGLEATTDVDVPKRPAEHLGMGDRIFNAVSTAAAFTSLVVIGLTFIFLLKESRLALSKAGVVDFFRTSRWSPDFFEIGVGGLILGTLLIAIIAVVVAVPMALAMALFINEYAPQRVRAVLTSVIDLLAAVPSLIYGMWGLFALGPRLVPISLWITEHLSVVPLLRRRNPDLSPTNFAGSALIGGIVVGIMIVPIITSVSRDVMAQVPREQCEGALGLGGSRWGMIREVILPFGRSGIIGATLLGLGRALGETIAVALIVMLVIPVNWHVAETGGGSIAGNIVIRFGEAQAFERSALVASGLALFVITFVVNLFARSIVKRAHLGS